MIQLQNLPSADQAKVGAKLAELQQVSGRAWTCEITTHQQIDNHGYLLEVAVDGRFQKPVPLSRDMSAERICGELDSLYRALNS